ncbi:hypothetical protein NM688_g8073 [Phlebia brevispora]|uniref:Uncharacterized protein n=1 Tax=Phlebia brevispora TaxID=194682 RepID=A0ACC1RXN6_9APHY|nr:hypothetical protein NM688_g8073 [Phlebia brevispora]
MSEPCAISQAISRLYSSIFNLLACSASQETTLVAAALAAQNYAAAALSYTLARSISPPRFLTWFGTAADHDTVLIHFTNLSGNNYSAHSLDCACSCTDSSVYAYSGPTAYGKVFLCGSF